MINMTGKRIQSLREVGVSVLTRAAGMSSIVLSYRFVQTPEDVRSIAVTAPATLLNAKLAIVRSADLKRGVDFDFEVKDLNPASHGRMMCTDSEVLIDGVTIEVRFRRDFSRVPLMPTMITPAAASSSLSLSLSR